MHSHTAPPPTTPRLGVATDDHALLPTDQVRALVGGVTDMCLWRWTRDERVLFPKPDVVINRRRYWRFATIQAWRERMERATPKAA
jgi:hypothetical protein